MVFGTGLKPHDGKLSDFYHYAPAQKEHRLFYLFIFKAVAEDVSKAVTEDVAKAVTEDVTATSMEWENLNTAPEQVPSATPLIGRSTITLIFPFTHWKIKCLLSSQPQVNAWMSTPQEACPCKHVPVSVC